MATPRNYRKAKASFSNGNCVEVASEDGVIFVRDTQDRDGTEAHFPAEAWLWFLRSVRGDG